MLLPYMCQQQACPSNAMYMPYVHITIYASMGIACHIRGHLCAKVGFILIVSTCATKFTTATTTIDERKSMSVYVHLAETSADQKRISW